MAPRIQKESEVVNGFRYSLHFDGGGPVSSQEFVTIKPVEDSTEDWHITRWFYFDEQSDRYERNFGKKVCENEQYRQSCLDRTADRAVIADVFEPLEHKLYAELYQSGSVSMSKLESVLKEIFLHTKSEVRDNNRTDISQEEILEEVSLDIVRQLPHPTSLGANARSLVEGGACQ